MNPYREYTKKIACLAAIFILMSCSSIPNYVEPELGRASAKVRVVHTQPSAYQVFVSTFDISCTHKTNVGLLGGDAKDEIRLGMLDSKPPSAATIERRVLANTQLVIGPRWVVPTASFSDVLFGLRPDVQEEVRRRFAGSCALPSFVPEANAEYEVVLDIAPGNCSVVPYRLNRRSDTTVVRDSVSVTPTPIQINLFDLKCNK